MIAKHHSTFGRDKVIGLAIVPGTSLNDQLNLTLSLGTSHTVSDLGQAIINVLCSRTYDEFAKEFVALKSTLRSEEGDEKDGPCSSSPISTIKVSGRLK